MKLIRETPCKGILIENAAELNQLITPDLFGVTSHEPINGITEFFLAVIPIGSGAYDIMQIQMAVVDGALINLCRSCVQEAFGQWSTPAVSSAVRPHRLPGFTMFDSNLSKPIWLKSIAPDVAEVCTLAIALGETMAAGTITITLDAVDTTVEILAEDTAPQIATKIQAATFTGWDATVEDNVVTFTKATAGANSAPAFDDTDATGALGVFIVTTPGSCDIWVDATGTEV